jgi:hypothetical protein
MKKILRAATEITFIMFLFYSNLLMGELEHSGLGQSKGLVWAIRDMFTLENFLVGLAASIIGYIFFEFLRQKL